MNDVEMKECINEIKKDKYKLLINNINESIFLGPLDLSMLHLYGAYAETDCKKNTALALIYDYNKCNDLAKIIMDKSILKFVDDKKGYSMDSEYPNFEVLKDKKVKIEASRKLAKMCNKEKSNGYLFIFWALMVLTVDKTDAENHIAIICNFAKIFGIPKDGFEDIIHAVKAVYDETEKKYKCKSADTPAIIRQLFKK